MPVRPVRTILAAALVAAAAAPVRADRIDTQLHEHAPAILDALKKHHIKTVGVLRFRVERGSRPESFDAGPVNDGLAARVENLLVLHADRANPVGVLRDPGHVAAAQKIGVWYSKPAERRRLFDLTYPMAWGTAQGKPDGFLTGEVRCKGDMLKTTVAIELFTAADPGRTIPVTEFTVDTDRLLLADLGARFNVAKRGGVGKRAADLDRFAIGEARRRDEAPPGGDPTAPPSPGGTTPPTDPPIPVGLPPMTTLDVGGVQVSLTAGGAEQVFRLSSSAAAKYELPCPPPGQPVAVKLKNNSGRRVGVVLKVNEVSTIFEQVEDSAQCRKWVLDPSVERTIQGFYLEGGKLAPFKVLVGDEAKQVIDQLGDKAGKVRVEVFEESVAADAPAPTEQRSLGLSRRLPATRSVARRDLATLQDALLHANKLKRSVKTETVGGKAVKREIIVADKDQVQTGPELKEVTFQAAPEPVAAELIQIVKP